MDRPRDAIDELISNLRALIRYQEADANDSTRSALPVGLVPDRHLVQISDHLWMNQYAFANSYAVVADSGNALFLDYGYPTFHHFVGGYRFTSHSIRELMGRGGLKRIDLCIPSHYHDDHIGGIPYLQQHYGTAVWAHEKVVDLLEHPGQYALPCLLPEPIRVDRTLRDGETFHWEGIPFTIFHTPGHTHYHSALCFEIDGLRVAHTGDTLHAGTVGPILGGPIYQNRFKLGDFERSVERIRAWGPQLLLTGHSGLAEVDDAWLDIAMRRAREGSNRLCALVANPEEPGFSMDPFWVSIHPYDSKALRGQDVALDVHVRNPGGDATITVCLVAPPGWRTEPAEATVHLVAGEEGAAQFTVHVPAEWPDADVVVVCADVTRREEQQNRRHGQLAEAFLRIEAGDTVDRRFLREDLPLVDREAPSNPPHTP
jgi:glyoxylase-like metal-dependent hydrolase (beta-lactamase superfamily II)